MSDLIALIRAWVRLIRTKPHGRHHRTGPRPYYLPPPARVELWPAPDPIVMDGTEPCAYNLHHGPYLHLERQHLAQRAERDRRGIDLPVQIVRSTPAFDDMAELRDLVRTPLKAGAVRR